ncbi:hypothetical protein VDGL01_03644 [Verticillium dahliae]
MKTFTFANRANRTLRTFEFETGIMSSSCSTSRAPVYQPAPSAPSFLNLIPKPSQRSSNTKNANQGPNSINISPSTTSHAIPILAARLRLRLRLRPRRARLRQRLRLRLRHGPARQLSRQRRKNSIPNPLRRRRAIPRKDVPRLRRANGATSRPVNEILAAGHEGIELAAAVGDEGGDGGLVAQDGGGEARGPGQGAGVLVGAGREGEGGGGGGEGGESGEEGQGGGGAGGGAVGCFGGGCCCCWEGLGGCAGLFLGEGGRREGGEEEGRGWLHGGGWMWLQDFGVKPAVGDGRSEMRRNEDSTQRHGSTTDNSVDIPPSPLSKPRHTSA